MKDIRDRFAERCKALREEAGLTQEQFAEKIHMNRSYYSLFELGGRNIALKNIEKIANGLGIPLEELFRDL